MSIPYNTKRAGAIWALKKQFAVWTENLAESFPAPWIRKSKVCLLGSWGESGKGTSQRSGGRFAFKVQSRILGQRPTHQQKQTERLEIKFYEARKGFSLKPSLCHGSQKVPWQRTSSWRFPSASNWQLRMEELIRLAISNLSLAQAPGYLDIYHIIFIYDNWKYY